MHKNTGAHAGWILGDPSLNTGKAALETFSSRPFLRSRFYHITSGDRQRMCHWTWVLRSQPAASGNELAVQYVRNLPRRNHLGRAFEITRDDAILLQFLGNRTYAIVRALPTLPEF